MSEDNPDIAGLRKAGEIIRNGGLVAFPTETVYGLGGNALDPGASKKIYAAKGRPSDNPLIVHIADMEDLYTVARDVPPEAEKLAARYWPGPLTMIFEKTDIVPYETTGGLETVAVRFPVNKIAQGMIRYGGGFVAAPSANISGRPSPTVAERVIEDLGDRIDMIIDGGHTDIGLESTIVDFTGDEPVILRPGFLNRKMLEDVLGTVETDPGITDDNACIRPKAPGMKYKHYAPRAEVTIVEGDADRVREKISSLVHRSILEGRKTGVICTKESRDSYREGDIKVIGTLDDDLTIARNLFEYLREFDDDGCDCVYTESFRTPRLGDAIMNRLIKSAGHKVIQV